MGLNAKEISLSFSKMIVAFYNTSHTFVQKHPIVSGVFSVCFILYIFLSYIYSFLAYLSPFIVVTAIFIRIFWTSEQPQLRYVKREKRRSDFKHLRLAGKYGRSDFVLDRYYSHSSHYNTSRRRSSRDKKRGLHGGNTEFNNAISEINTENKGFSSLDRSIDSSSDNGLPAKKSMSPDRQTLRSEPSMSDLVHLGIIEGIKEDENEGPKEEDNDRVKDVAGLPKIDKKDSIDVGLLELERKSRMESLINSKARKELKIQLDKGVNPTHHLAPVLVPRSNSFRGSKRFDVDGTEMPESAPSIIRHAKTFNFLCNSSPQKANLHQESTQGNQKDKAISRNESFSVGRFRRVADKGKGSHDKLIEQLFIKCDTYDESGWKSPKTQSNCKEADTNNGAAEIDKNTSGSQNAGDSEKPEQRVQQMTTEKVPKFPISNSTTINESLFKSLVAPPTEKNQENMFYTGRQLRKTPTHSIASDLQVEVSEVGSPTKAFNSSNEESSVYDGDNEKDYSSGSEDMWENNSVHVRDLVPGIHDFEGTPKANMNSHKDIVPLQEIDEEDSADVSSVSSTCGLPGDTPTCAVSSDQNLFGDMGETVMQNETAQPLNPLDVPSSSQTNSERVEEWCKHDENYTKEEADVVRDINDSATIDKDHIDNKTSNRDHGLTTLHQKSIADISVESNLSFSPRSVLPKKNPTDEVSSFASDQQGHTQVPQPKMDDTAKTTSSGELHSHNADFTNFQTSIADEAEPDVEAKKEAQDSSAHLAEKEPIDLTKLAAGTSSANIPIGKKVPLSKEKQVESQTSVNQESAAEPSMNSKAMDSRSSDNFEEKHDDSKENKAVSSETEHSEEPRRVIQPENLVMPTTMQNSELTPEDKPPKIQRVIQHDNLLIMPSTMQNGELPPEDKPPKMQYFRSGYLTT